MTARRPKVEEIRSKAESLVGMLESLEDDIRRRRYHEAYRRAGFALADAKELLELLEEYDPCADCGGGYG
jgi:DNA repair exonuclease SbcCD ATPase subunit